MKIDKAIEILNLYLTNSYQGDEQDLWTARHLGIEALKRYQEIKHQLTFSGMPPLPGETEE